MSYRYPDPQVRHRQAHRRQFVLQLDAAGVPQAWISVEEAAVHIATDSVSWFDGEKPLALLRGGINTKSGRQSLIEVYPIVALKGKSKVNLFEVPPSFSRWKLICRDLHLCGFCGQQFKTEELTVDHILPQSRGGLTNFENTISCCGPCNFFKRDRLPEEAKMPLLFLPYRPSRWEDFLLAGRNVRADVNEWLKAKLPKGSRLC